MSSVVRDTLLAALNVVHQLHGNSMSQSSLLVASLLLFTGLLVASAPVHSQLPFPDTSAPAPSTPVEPETTPPLSTAQIVPEIVAAEQDLSTIRERLTSYDKLPAIPPLLLEQDVILIQLEEYLKDHPVSSMTPGRFREARGSLVRFHSQLDRWQVLLQDRITELDHDSQSLQLMSEFWQSTRNDTDTRATPNALVRQIDKLLKDIHAVEDSSRNQIGNLVELQSRVGKRLIQISEQLEAMNNEELNARDALLGFDQPPLWSLSTSKRQRGSIQAELSELSRIEAQEMRIYWETSNIALKRQALFFVLLCVFLIILHRRRVMRMVLTDEMTPAMHLISKPIPAAMLIALLTTRWWQPQAPPSVREIAMVLTVFPVIYLLAGLLGRRLMSAVILVQVMIVLVVLRSFALAGSPLDRIILLSMGPLQLVALTLTLRASSTEFDKIGIHPGGLSRTLMKLGLGLALVAIFLNVFGNVYLSDILTAGTFVGVMLMVWLPLGYLVLKAIFRFILTSNVALTLRTVQSHGKLIYTRISFGLRVLVVALWIYYVIRFFSLGWIWSILWQALQWELQIGSFRMSPTSAVLFVAMLWIAVLVARFVRFVLENELLARLSLERGVPTAISRLVHYTLVGIGVFVASSAAGLSFSQLAIITGALSVGIGFGLQNVVNNFVSGLILIVERPVDVGDTVEVGTLIGRVRTIGLRSSVVRTTTGAEVIVPNANFIANEVINWTLSDQHRRIEIPVGVAYGTDPHRVIDALMVAAKEKDGVLAVPEPVVLFDGFGDSSLDFQLRFWTPEFQGWRLIRSAVALAIHDELKKAGIEIPFPQRDLHLRSADHGTRQALEKLPQTPTPPST